MLSIRVLVVISPSCVVTVKISNYYRRFRESWKHIAVIAGGKWFVYVVNETKNQLIKFNEKFLFDI